MTLHDMLAKRSTIKDAIPGEKGIPGLTVTYSPSNVTPSAMATMRAITKDGEKPEEDAVIDLLVLFGMEWDLKKGGDGKDKDQIVPTDAESLRSIPTMALVAILAAIQEDLLPNRQKSAS